VTSEGSVTVRIFNPGPWNIEYGLMYKIEKMINGTWTPVEDHTIWAMMAISMGAGFEWSQSVNTSGLDPGLYRVSKEIVYDGQKQMFYAEFTVKRPLELADRQTLVELVLNNYVKVSLQVNITNPDLGLILLSTPNLLGVNVPDVVQGVPIRFLNHEEIDALSMVKPLNYMFFEKISKSDLYTAEVDLTFRWDYRADARTRSVGENSGEVFNCSKQADDWIVSSSWFWVP
jgi:hypothetical protein